MVEDRENSVKGGSSVVGDWDNSVNAWSPATVARGNSVNGGSSVVGDWDNSVNGGSSVVGDWDNSVKGGSSAVGDWEHLVKEGPRLDIRTEKIGPRQQGAAKKPARLSG
ncbi:conserved hypothetical protein [Teredinibacter turnerae T7901]|uniref:Uncharacterized protein n=1 Tax=Teredinibacter turnerae (strain ATCC 39867 / T7901) TaxID=377629 RepID=C5BUH9_TERTT|nr:hypothetical protein [Teredinibacter turnerae]ACR13060.1 conserved hypothetical protein [Teredinibacter turnerae T7901]